QETRASTFLAPKAIRAVEQTFHKPLEANRHFTQCAAERSHNPVNEAAADEGLANNSLLWPLGPVSQEGMDGHGKVMVGIHQSHRTGNNAMAVCISVVGESNVELILQPHETSHSVRAGTIHPDLPVMIQGHEAERWVHLGINHRDVETENSFDRLPVM